MISNFEGGEVEEIPALVNGKKRKSGASGDEATPATKKLKKPAEITNHSTIDG